MNNWKKLLVIFTIIFLLILQGWDYPDTTSNDIDLLEIVSVLENEEVHITEWSIYAREKLENLEGKEYAASLREKFPNWQWTENENSSHWELEGTNSLKGHTENIKVMTAENDSSYTYIIYELKGGSFNKESRQFIKENWSTTAFDIFRENATIFSCIKGEFSANINTTLSQSINRLIALFQAEKVESIEEKNFISTTAYSPRFAKSINSDENEMNMQIGIRSEGLGAKTTLVVGTPIITVEY